MQATDFKFFSKVGCRTDAETVASFVLILGRWNHFSRPVLPVLGFYWYQWCSGSWMLDCWERPGFWMTRSSPWTLPYLVELGLVHKLGFSLSEWNHVAGPIFGSELIPIGISSLTSLDPSPVDVMLAQCCWVLCHCTGPVCYSENWCSLYFRDCCPTCWYSVTHWLAIFIAVLAIYVLVMACNELMYGPDLPNLTGSSQFVFGWRSFVLLFN